MIDTDSNGLQAQVHAKRHCDRQPLAVIFMLIASVVGGELDRAPRRWSQFDMQLFLLITSLKVVSGDCRSSMGLTD